MPSEMLAIAGTAALATVLYYMIAFVVLHAIFRRRDVPDSGLGRVVAFAATRIVILPVLDVVDWLARYGDADIASWLLPEGLEPLAEDRT